MAVSFTYTVLRHCQLQKSKLEGDSQNQRQYKLNI